MSLVTHMMIAEKYGARLGMEQLAEVLGDDAKRLRTYCDFGQRFADYREVAEYLNAALAEARRRLSEPVIDWCEDFEWPPAPPPRPDYSTAPHWTRRYWAEIERTPVWANFDVIDALYAESRKISRETGIPHHVDHVIPLRGKLVSGLHVEGNLQIITASENCSKHNRFEVE